MATKKKRRKFTDPLYVSNQKWEIQHISDKFNLTPARVRAVKKKVGRSRRKIYKFLREGRTT